MAIMGLFNRDSDDDSKSFRERVEEIQEERASEETDDDSQDDGDSKSFRERVREIQEERASEETGNDSRGSNGSFVGELAERAKEGISALTDHHAVRIHDYHNVGAEVKESGATMTVTPDELDFRQSAVIGDDVTFSISKEEIDFQQVEVWTREDHETENLKNRLHGDDYPSSGERTFIELPLESEGYLTISIGRQSAFDSNPNQVLRELRNMSGVQLRKRESRSPPTQPDDTEQEQKQGQDPLDQLERLKELRDEGAITEDEFEDKKQDLLDQI